MSRLRISKIFLTHFGAQVATLALLMTQGCGLVHLGSSGGNASIPPGISVASGIFLPLNGQTVSGGASIYNDSGSYYLYINGLSAPNQNGLVFVVTASGVPLPQISLQSSSGSQSYAISVSVSNPVFQYVTIHSTNNNEDYGEAIFN